MSFGGGRGGEVQREEAFFLSVSVDERGRSFFFAAVCDFFSLERMT
jgi:hypothetical protein